MRQHEAMMEYWLDEHDRLKILLADAEKTYERAEMALSRCKSPLEQVKLQQDKGAALTCMNKLRSEVKEAWGNHQK